QASARACNAAWDLAELGHHHGNLGSVRLQLSRSFLKALSRSLRHATGSVASTGLTTVLRSPPSNLQFATIHPSRGQALVHGRLYRDLSKLERTRGHERCAGVRAAETRTCASASAIHSIERRPGVRLRSRSSPLRCRAIALHIRT